MRPIRFRAYDKVAGYMFDPGIVSLHQDRDIHSVTVISSLGDEQTVPIEQVDLMQFTGLVDKNGVEIFEGDVVKIDWNDARYEPVIRTITWDSGEAAFNFGAGLPSEVSWSHEVIGNIYINPELL